VQCQVTLALRKSIIDHGAGETQALVFTVSGTDGQTGFDAVLVGIGETYFFKGAIYGRFDLFDIGCSQRFVLATCFTGMNRLDGGWNLDLDTIRHFRVRIHWIQAIIFYSMH